MTTSALHWFRRDLRLTDNKALAAALGGFERVHCVFVFDTEILDALGRRADRRVEFILRSVEELAAALEKRGGSLIVLHGAASEEIPRLARQLQVECVFANRDYEPSTIARDAKVDQALSGDGIAFIRVKDQVIFEQDETPERRRPALYRLRRLSQGMAEAAARRGSRAGRERRRPRTPRAAVAGGSNPDCPP